MFSLLIPLLISISCHCLSVTHLPLLFLLATPTSRKAWTITLRSGGRASKPKMAVATA